MSGLELGDKLGIQAAVAELHDPARAPGVQAEQLALLPTGSNAVQGAKNTAELDDSPRGAGRPAGAKNRSTEQWKRYLLNRGGSPLVHLQDASNATVQEFAEKLGWPVGMKLPFEKALEIVKLQLACAEKLAPYVHQKQPLAIDTGEGGLMTLVIGGLPGQHHAPVGGDDFGITILNDEATENQQVIGFEAQESNETKSNETAVIEENRHASQVSAGDLESASGEAL